MLAAQPLPPDLYTSENPQADKCTIFGLQPIIPYVSASLHDVWQDAISLLLHLWTNPPLAERLTQDLKDWEDQNAVDWEHTLMLIIARYTLPSSHLRVFGDLPIVHFAIGDVCSFGGDSDGRLMREATYDGSQLYVKDQGDPSVDGNSSLTVTSSLASYKGDLVKHTLNTGVLGTSYVVELTNVRLGWLFRDDRVPTFGVDVTLSLLPEHSQHTFWCNVRHGLSSAPAGGHSLDSLSELELVVSISIIARIQLNTALSKHWDEIVSYLKEERSERRIREGRQNPNTIAEDNPFAQLKLYFHRHETASASPREYWGFWSLNSDPTGETGLEGCEEKIKLEVTTLPMENELDKEIEKREEERLAGIPGGWN